MAVDPQHDRYSNEAEKLKKTFIMISNWKKTFWSPWFIVKYMSALSGLNQDWVNITCSRIYSDLVNAQCLVLVQRRISWAALNQPLIISGVLLWSRKIESVSIFLALINCLSNVGPPSAMLAQQWSNIGSVSVICRWHSKLMLTVYGQV